LRGKDIPKNTKELERDRDEEKQLEIFISDNPLQADGLRLPRQYRSQLNEFDQTDKKKVGHA
jgi:hypothetical protein